jgi:hypothetical protein
MMTGGKRPLLAPAAVGFNDAAAASAAEEKFGRGTTGGKRPRVA